MLPSTHPPCPMYQLQHPLRLLIGKPLGVFPSCHYSQPSQGASQSHPPSPAFMTLNKHNSQWLPPPTTWQQELLLLFCISLTEYVASVLVHLPVLPQPIHLGGCCEAFCEFCGTGTGSQLCCEEWHVDLGTFKVTAGRCLWCELWLL